MEKTENREMRISKTFKAPIGLVWKVWTDPEHIVNWHDFRLPNSIITVDIIGNHFLLGKTGGSPFSAELPAEF